MKFKILVTVFLLFFLFNVRTFASYEENINEQKESFGISDFLKESEKYTSDFYKTTDIKTIFNNAITGKIDNSTIFNGIISIFGKEILSAIQTFSSILIIIIIHSILNTISDSLKNSNVSQVIFYMQYALIVTIIMMNFSDVINIVKETTENLVGFINTLIPILISLMMYTGNIVTSSVVEPVILFMINLLGNSINMILLPITLVVTVLSIVSKISDKIQINKLTKLLNSVVIWSLGIMITLFVATISIEGSLSSSVDGITAKTTKAAVSTVIPVVGKILRRCC